MASQGLSVEAAVAAELDYVRSQLGGELSRWVLALSGGVDSVSLLDLLVKAQPPEPILIIHVNHQLQPEAGSWARFCAQLAGLHSQSFILETVEITAEEQKTLGLEAAARAKRYQVLEKHLQPRDVLLTAQHQDDQAETLLLQLMRGAGVAGLASMPRLKARATGWHARPLLGCSKEQLLDYANARALDWVDDPSNVQQQYDRNFLRRSVIPLLRDRWPAASRSIATSAAHCAGANRRVERSLMRDIERGAEEGLVLVGSASWQSPPWLSLDRYDLDHLRYWLDACGEPKPSAARLSEFWRQAHSAAECGGAACPSLEWGQVALRYFRQRIWLSPLRPAKQPIGLCHVEGGVGGEALTFRRGGEKIHPCYGGGSLKKLFNEQQIFPWLRDAIPLLMDGERVAAIAGLQGYQRAPNGAVMVWRDAPRICAAP